MTEDYAILQFLCTIPDPRIDRCKKYSLESILFITLLEMLCGADSFSEMVDFGEAKMGPLLKMLDLTGCI